MYLPMDKLTKWKFISHPQDFPTFLPPNLNRSHTSPAYTSYPAIIRLRRSADVAPGVGLDLLETWQRRRRVRGWWSVILIVRQCVRLVQWFPTNEWSSMAGIPSIDSHCGVVKGSPNQIDEKDEKQHQCCFSFLSSANPARTTIPAFTCSYMPTPLWYGNISNQVSLRVIMSINCWYGPLLRWIYWIVRWAGVSEARMSHTPAEV